MAGKEKKGRGDRMRAGRGSVYVENMKLKKRERERQRDKHCRWEMDLSLFSISDKGVEKER